MASSSDLPVDHRGTSKGMRNPSAHPSASRTDPCHVQGPATGFNTVTIIGDHLSQASRREIQGANMPKGLHSSAQGGTATQPHSSIPEICPTSVVQMPSNHLPIYSQSLQSQTWGLVPSQSPSTGVRGVYTSGLGRSFVEEVNGRCSTEQAGNCVPSSHPDYSVGPAAVPMEILSDANRMPSLDPGYSSIGGHGPRIQGQSDIFTSDGEDIELPVEGSRMEPLLNDGLIDDVPIDEAMPYGPEVQFGIFTLDGEPIDLPFDESRMESLLNDIFIDDVPLNETMPDCPELDISENSGPGGTTQADFVLGNWIPFQVGPKFGAPCYRIEIPPGTLALDVQVGGLVRFLMAQRGFHDCVAPSDAPLVANDVEGDVTCEKSFPSPEVDPPAGVPVRNERDGGYRLGGSNDKGSSINQPTLLTPQAHTDTVFRCPFLECKSKQKQFDAKALRRHIMTVHAKVLNLPSSRCPFSNCPASHNRRDNWLKHLRNFHAGDIEQLARQIQQERAKALSS
ncbi:MAG: hypothetical protein M1816_005047 [Peltula sp. TS41687]|nr:MAG: hypothetical protein M1816_005047 [Peltula sp. TS41687]